MRPNAYHTALLVAVTFAAIASVTVLGSATTQKFYADDPLMREPETQDASRVAAWDILLTYDLLQNLVATPGDKTDQRAQNVNSIDEVPDSNWFTNRVIGRPLSMSAAARSTTASRAVTPANAARSRAR